MAKDKSSKAEKLPIMVRMPLHAILSEIADKDGRFIEAITQETLITGLKLKYPAYKEQLDQLFAPQVEPTEKAA